MFGKTRYMYTVSSEACSNSSSLNNLATEPKPTLEVPPATLLCCALPYIVSCHTVLYLNATCVKFDVSKFLLPHVLVWSK